MVDTWFKKKPKEYKHTGKMDDLSEDQRNVLDIIRDYAK